MTLGVFLLVLSAAISHAGWNFATRKVSGNMVIVWLSVWCGGLFTLPLAIHQEITAGFIESISTLGWVCIIASGIIHAFYFILLTYAYQHDEISVVYPIARGSGIGLTAILGWSLLDENISLLGAIGIGLIITGILTLGNSGFAQKEKSQGITFALYVGGTIVSYSLVDKIGVSEVDPVIYLCFMFIITAVLMGPYVWRRHQGTILQTARDYYPYILLIGIGVGGTYLIILFAFTMGPVSYIVAVREFAVVIGAFLGFVFLKESLTLPKGIAVVAITLGLICIKSG